MQHEPGDDYLRRLASFIRSNDRNLAEAGLPRRRQPQRPAPSSFNPLGWLGIDASTQATTHVAKPIVLALDTHRLFYVLMRLEAIGIDVGTLDVRVDSPSRPMSYVDIFSNSDKSDTMSLASFRSSLSVVSGLSLGAGWWGRPEPPTLDAELKYIFSSFTKVPALSVCAPGRKGITELANDPNENALPLDTFKNLQSLECLDIDPRTLLGWDRLAESLRSLKIRKSGVEDVSDIFIGAVIDDQARREGSTSRKRCRRIPRGMAKQASFYTTRLPDTVVEDANEDIVIPESGSPSPPPTTQLSHLKWSFLRHLSLSDNALTFFPSDPLPYLTSLTHLDLSSNLLVSVPPGLGTLYNLISLNLSDNMIDSVLGIYLNLGQILRLNISHNRLESICGLERLHALEYVDLRSNLVDESAEVGRLATLPNIAEVWIQGNPLVEVEEGYRIACFDYFWKEGKNITLDGTQPGFYEKRNLTVAPPEQMSSSRLQPSAPSPPVKAIGHPHQHPSPPVNAAENKPSPSTSNSASPHLSPLGAVGVTGRERRKKKNKRIVELDADYSDTSTRSASHTRTQSDGSTGHRTRSTVKITPSPLQPSMKMWNQLGPMIEDAALHPKAVDFIVDPSSANVLGSGLRAAATIVSSGTSTNADPLVRHPHRSQHVRRQTELPPISSSKTADAESKYNLTSISQSVSPPGALSRRGRNASVYEPPTSLGVDEDRDNADAYRKRIEALKKDMGDGWLKVFSQSQMKSPV